MFNFAFESENGNTTQPYAVCVDTTDENSSVQIPFLTGMYYILQRYADQLIQTAENEKQSYLTKIASNQQIINTNESMNIVSKSIRKSQTKELQSTNVALRSEMGQKEIALKNNPVWLSRNVIRNALQTELFKYRNFLLTDFTRGDLEITIPASIKKRHVGLWSFEKPTGKEIVFAILFGLFNLIGIVGVCVYSKKKKYTPCLIIILSEFLFALFVDSRPNVYLIGGIICSIIFFIFGIVDSQSKKNHNQ